MVASATIFGMVTHSRKTDRAIRKILALERTASSRYTFFVTGNPDDGYRWELVDRNDDRLCLSDVFAQKADCLKTLRAVQRHAAPEDLRDDTL